MIYNRGKNLEKVASCNNLGSYIPKYITDFFLVSVSVEPHCILSRTRKSKIMYIGSWADREDSPLPWLQVTKELKVFVCSQFLVLMKGPYLGQLASQGWLKFLKAVTL